MYVFDFEGRIKKCTYLGNCVLLLLFLRIIKRRFNPVLKLCEKTGNFVEVKHLFFTMPPELRDRHL